MRHLQIGIVVALLVCLTVPHDSSRASDLDFPLVRITNRVHVIYGPFDLPDRNNRGFRNNVVIVSTSKGVVVFDPGGSAAAGEMVVQKIKTITQAPIVAVFDSHAHGDHWLGNEGIRRSYPDAVIYGHPTLKAKLEGPEGERWLTTVNGRTNGTADGKRVIAPDRTVTEGDVIEIGDTAFRVYHAGRAHTDNDIMIEIVGENVLFTGDVVRNGLLGIIEDDASFKGNIAAIDRMLAKQFRHYIPGHGEAGAVEVLKNYRGYLATLRRTVQQLYEQGLADFEMKPKVLTALAAYRQWAGFEMRVGPHISRAYLEIEAEAF